MSDTINETIDFLKAVFNKKQVEYKAGSTDTYRNFNQGALLQGETAEQTLLGYVNKQIVNLYDAKHNTPQLLTDYDFIKEKAGDIAIYMILLISMVKDKSNDTRC